MKKVICKGCKKLITYHVDYWNELVENPKNREKLKDVIYYEVKPGVIWTHQQRTTLTAWPEPNNKDTRHWIEDLKKTKVYYLCEQCLEDSTKWLGKYH